MDCGFTFMDNPGSGQPTYTAVSKYGILGGV